MGHFSILGGGAMLATPLRSWLGNAFKISARYDGQASHEMSTPGPNLVVVAGPNGAGKTTAAADVLAGALAVQEFVNADIIAKGLSSFRPDSVAFDAGRINAGSACAISPRSGPMWRSRRRSPAAHSLHGLKRWRHPVMNFACSSSGCRPPIWPSSAYRSASGRAAMPCRKRSSDRKSVVKGKSVDLGGRR